MRISRILSRTLRQNVNTYRMRKRAFSETFCRHDPETIMVFVTNRCNFSCNTCPFTQKSPWSPPPDIPDISPELFSRILNTYAGATMVGLVGGEPLLHPGLDDLVQMAAAKKMKVSLSTNGSLLTGNRILHILNLPLESMNISVDAVDPQEFLRLRGGDPEMYRTILNNAALFGSLRKEHRKNLSFKLSFVTDSNNLHRIPECFDLARRMGADTVFCQTVLSYHCSTVTSGDSILWDTPENRQFLQTLSIPDDLCFVPPLLVSVTADDNTAACIHPFNILATDGAGNLSPCCVIPPHHRFGNLSNGIDGWRNGDGMKAIRSEMLNRKTVSETICLQCWERFSMRAGEK